jgi:hypothetical protein
LVRKPEGKQSLRRLRRRWEYNIKMDVREKGWVWAEFIWLKIQAGGKLL